MMIEDYERLRVSHEIKRIRRATFCVLLLDVVLIVTLGVIIYITCTSFLDTSLSEGIAKLSDWVRGVR